MSFLFCTFAAILGNRRKNNKSKNIKRMKKTLKMTAILAVVATLMSGCITATILLTKWASDEKEEITGGKVFEVAQATVTYSDGSVLAFKNHGKYIRFTRSNGEFVIITPDYCYECFPSRKGYARQANNNGTFYYSNLSYVFPVEWFRWERFADDVINDVNKKEGTKVVAGQTCKSFSDSDTDYEVAGYKRIYMYKEVNGTVLRRAVEYTSSENAEYEVPAGWEKIGNSIDFSEDF